MKKYTIINGKLLTIIFCANMQDAKEKSLLFCDQSKEIIIREIEKIYISEKIKSNLY